MLRTSPSWIRLGDSSENYPTLVRRVGQVSEVEFFHFDIETKTDFFIQVVIFLCIFIYTLQAGPRLVVWICESVFDTLE